MLWLAAILSFATSLLFPTVLPSTCALNGYEAILGATFLMNPDMTSAITPTHLCLTPEYRDSSIKLETVQKKIQGNFMHCKQTTIPPGVSTNISATVSPPFLKYSKKRTGNYHCLWKLYDSRLHPNFTRLCAMHYKKQFK